MAAIGSDKGMRKLPWQGLHSRQFGVAAGYDNGRHQGCLHRRRNEQTMVRRRQVLNLFSLMS